MFTREWKSLSDGTLATELNLTRVLAYNARCAADNLTVVSTGHSDLATIGDAVAFLNLAAVLADAPPSERNTNTIEGVERPHAEASHEAAKLYTRKEHKDTSPNHNNTHTHTTHASDTAQTTRIQRLHLRQILCVRSKRASYGCCKSDSTSRTSLLHEDKVSRNYPPLVADSRTELALIETVTQSRTPNVSLSLRLLGILSVLLRNDGKDKPLAQGERRQGEKPLTCCCCWP